MIAKNLKGLQKKNIYENRMHIMLRVNQFAYIVHSNALQVYTSQL